MNAVQLSWFTPSLMSAEALEALFVQRHALVDRLVDLVRESATGDGRHQSLLVGPRGIGKTHLISLIHHRIQADPELRDALRIAWLREEEWGVSSFLELLLRILRALYDGYDDPELRERTDALFDLRPDEAEEGAATLVEEFLEGRTLLLAENLDDIFRGLGKDGQQRLRAHLQDHGSWSILATTQALFGGISLQTSSFYGFFRIEHLQELNLGEAVELLQRIARGSGDEALADLIVTPQGRARVRAVHELAGGNHRIYVMLSRFLTLESFEDLVEPFFRLLDELTPYYQERMKYLSPQQRKLVDLLCDDSSALQVKEIARRCFVTQQVASSQLKQLREKGYVRSKRRGRDSLYVLREPLMKMCIDVKRDRGGPIRLFVDFLRLWFTTAELEGMSTGVLLSPLEREHVEAALVASRADPDPRLAAVKRDIGIAIDAKNWPALARATEDLVAIDPTETGFVLLIKVLARIRTPFPEIEAVVDKARQGFPDSADLLAFSAIYTGAKGEHASAVEMGRRASREGASIFGLEHQLAISLLHLGQREEAIEIGEAALLRRPPAAQSTEGEAAVMASIVAPLGALLETGDADLWKWAAPRWYASVKKGDHVKHWSAALLLLGTYGLTTNVRELSWLDAWSETVPEGDPAQVTIAMARAFVRYRETGDESVLMDVPLVVREPLQRIHASLSGSE